MMRNHRSRRAAACALLLLAACAHARATAPAVAPPLRVMTFNIRYGTADDGANAWPMRRQLVLRVIREFQPDLLGVQEALRFQLDELQAGLGGYGELGVGRDDGREAGEYSAILYDRQRLEDIEHGTFWLSDSPAEPGSMSWGNRIPRIVTWARFRERQGGATFYAFNTHWDHESQPSRERSAELLLRRIAARTVLTDPVIITGDFNAGESNPALRALVTPASDVAFRDSYRVVHPDARVVGTFNGFAGDSTGDKIDAVLVTAGWRVRAAGIVRSVADGRYPSDHFPVTAVLARARDE
jgi:endonuclease/exonuclease/phosphatase family metal-dependent hydrolase